MPNFYEQRQQHLKNQFGIDKLEMGYVNPHGTIDLTPKKETKSKHLTAHETRMREKFQLPNGLQLEGGLTKRTEQTVSDCVHELNRNDARKVKLAVGSCKWQGRDVKLWYSVTR